MPRGNFYNTMTKDYDFLFAKSKLSKDVINLGIGENNILREAVIETYGLNNLNLTKFSNIFEYAPPYGYDALVEELEDLYPGKVVIFQSAKHALSGAFHTLKAVGKNKIHLQNPYWASFPSLITREGLEYSHDYTGCDSQLLVSPNNPDGTFISDIMPGIPSIHDAAYYTHSYISRDFYLKTLGNIQIFSVAKMYGLSGIRLGFAVVNDCSEQGRIYYDHLVKFVEATTAGVSTMSQAVLLHILNQRYTKSKEIIEYEDYVRKHLNHNRLYCMENLNNNKFEIGSTDQIGMFLWLKSEKENFLDVGVNLMPGKAFGKEGHVRMNLAVTTDKIIKAVEKMNNA